MKLLVPKYCWKCEKNMKNDAILCTIMGNIAIVLSIDIYCLTNAGALELP